MRVCILFISLPHHEAYGISVLHPEIELTPSAQEAWYLNHWTTREIPRDLLDSIFKDESAGRGFPGGASGEEPAHQCRRHKRHEFDPWVRKTPWRREWQPTPVFLPGESHGQRGLAAYSPWGRNKSDVIAGYFTTTC